VTQLKCRFVMSTFITRKRNVNVMRSCATHSGESFFIVYSCESNFDVFYLAIFCRSTYFALNEDFSTHPGSRAFLPLLRYVSDN
jgi:hypothetical protein